MVSPLGPFQLPPAPVARPRRSALLTQARFWLLGIAAGIVTLHLTLVWQLDSDQLLSNSLLLWSGVCYLVWQQRSQFHPLSLPPLKPTPWCLSRTLGLLPIAFILVRSLTLPNGNFLAVFPLLGAIGLALLAAGLGGLRQFWRELLILSCLALPNLLFLVMSFDISVTTARFTAYLLWYSGWPVMLEGALLYLGEGAVNVAGGCSGQEQMFHLMGIGVMAVLIFPFRSRWRWGMVPGAIAIAFVINAVRVYLMTLLVAAGNQAGFEYWHDGSGSLIFSMISVGLFGWLYSSVSDRCDPLAMTAPSSPREGNP